MIPLASFLHRILPYGAYDDRINKIVNERFFKPRDDCEPFFLQSPIDWEAKDRLEDRNWRMQLQGWTYFHSIMNIFDEFADKDKLIAIFLDFSRDWYSVYGCDAEDIKTTRMPDSYAWYDMSVGFRALVIAFFLDRINCHNLSVTATDYAFIREVALKHVRHLRNEKVFSQNNHGIFQLQGLISLCQLLDNIESKDEMLAYGIRKMKELVSTQFSTNGIHLEHSPGYHFYVCSTFEAVTKSGWYATSEIISSRITKALERKRWLVDPLKRMICVGDSILTPQRSVNFLQTPEDSVSRETLISEFNESGYAVVRSAWKTAPEMASMLFLTAAYHSKSHKHRDCLSFDWFDKGERIVCDSGKYGYRSDRYRNYFLSARAHNSVEIEDFDIIKMKPYGSAVRDIEQVENDVYCITASLDYPAVNHKRQVYFSPGRWLAIFDNLCFHRARKFTQWFHLSPSFNLISISGTKVVAADKHRTLIIQCMDEGLEVSAYRGDEDALNGLVSEKDYKYESAWAIGFSGIDKQRPVITTLALGKEEHDEVLAFVANGFASPIQQSAPISVHKGGGDEETGGKSVTAESLSQNNGGMSGMLKGVPHHCVNADDERKFKLKDGKATYSVALRGLQFHFFANVVGSDALTILLPGAINREKGLIDFQRHSWAQDFGTSVISFSDPTINIENDISIGWFQGNEDEFGVDLLAQIIAGLLNDNGYAQSAVTILGSSAGGFVGLKLANKFPQARIVAINPQIFLFNYVRSHYERMMAACYPKRSLKDSESQHRDRIVVELPSPDREGRIYIIQNTMDDRHYELHLMKYLKQLKEDDFYITKIENAERDRVRRLNVLLYEDSLLGHSPPNKETTLRYLGIVDSL